VVNYEDQEGTGEGMARDRMKPLVDERGYSLAELLVLIGVIAILAIISVPTFLGRRL